MLTGVSQLYTHLATVHHSAAAMDLAPSHDHLQSIQSKAWCTHSGHPSSLREILLPLKSLGTKGSARGSLTVVLA